MFIDTLIAIGAWSAAVTAGVSVTAVAVSWYRYAKSNWANVTGNSFLKHCYKKYLQLNKARKKGYAGEHELSSQLDRVKGKKKVLYNVLIPSGPNGTTEIDALMVHETGIYVFENKNYSGTIGCFQKDKYNRKVLGNVAADAKRWDVVYKSGKKKSMYNSILQNETHLYFVKRLLAPFNVGQQRFFSYVTFNDGVRVKGAPVSFKFSSEGKMLMSKHLAEDLNSEIPQRSAILTSKTMNEIVNVLEPFARVKANERKGHIQRVNEAVSKIEQKEDKAEEKTEYSPLNDAIRSAEVQEHKQSLDKERVIAKNYMNMFRG